MERFGGVRNSRSGAGWSRKNDGRTSTELVEFKRTDNRRSITLLFDDLIALYRHAVAESRRPVLVFELGGREWVVLPEPSYHELVLYGPSTGSAGHLRADPSPMARQRKVQRAAWKPVLQRPPAQQHPGAGGPKRVPGNPPGAPRPLPGPGGLSRLRDRQRGTLGSVGRNQRKGATPDQAPEAP
jgi:hypothetical protein